MKIFTLFLFSVFLISSPLHVFGQQAPQSFTESIVLHKQANGFYQSEKLPIALSDVEPFLAYTLSWQNNLTVTRVPLQIRFSENGQDWAAWQTVEEGSHTNKELAQTIGELMFADKKNRYFQISLKYTQPLESLHVRWYNPQRTVTNGENVTSENPVSSSTCPCPLPEMESREKWCPSGNCPPESSPTATSVTHLIVHHSAGTNLANDWAAVVRSIWDYHVNSNGWDDIGYNYLVDPNGVLYEGRGDNILGAHFCGTNSKTMGTCVMGDFTNITPTESAKMGLTRLLAWKACDRNMNPLDSLFHGSSGLLLPRIAGHRSGCATACPGNSFYPLLPDIREGIAAFIDNGCEFLETKTDQFFNATTVQIFPNPTSDAIEIDVENAYFGSLQMELTNVEGKVLQQQIVDKNTNNIKLKVDLEEYIAGLYFIKIKTGEGHKSWKVIKK